MSDILMRRRVFRLAAIGSIVVLGAAVLAIPAASGAGSTKWVTVSTTNVNGTLTTPSIAKFGSTYEVIWVQRVLKKGVTSFSIEARILNAAGKPVGKQITVLSHWAGIQGDPTILSDGKQRLIAFGGDKEGKTSDYDNGAEYYLTSSNGKSWTLSTGSLSAESFADRDTGTAVIDDHGTLITGMAENDGIVYHIGASASNPAPGPDPITATTGNFAYDAGLGLDNKTHKVWALWYSNSGKNGQDGTNAQVIYPTLGTRLNAPGSSNPKVKSAGVEQDLSGASRIGGGVYTAYRTPNTRSIEVWKLGAKRPVATVKDPKGAESIVLTPAPKGRLWLYWKEGNDVDWRAARSNKAATRFGPATTLAVPKNDTQSLLIAANGAAGPLEVVATVSTPHPVNELIARQVLPKLSVSASPHAVKRGHSFTVKVTDAGDAVKGATVHFDGHKKKTNKKGKVSFKVPGGTSLGNHPVTLTMAGYAAARTTVKVT